MTVALQFGAPAIGRTHEFRATAFGLAIQDGLLACVRIDRGEASYLDLPGGAVDAGETEAQALAREFVEETGLSVRVDDRLGEAGQYLLKSNGRAVNNVGGFWTVSVLAHDPSAKCEDDHELVWLDPCDALRGLRHEAHAWAIASWMRRSA